MDFKIAVLAGDGIGPEISVQGVDVRALRKIYKVTLGRKFPMLTNYAVTIPPGGRTDAFVQTVITWSYDEQVFRTRGLDADQTEAAIKATMKMLNLIEDEYEKSK